MTWVRYIHTGDEETYLPLSEVANVTLTMLFWKIEQRIHRDILREKRADNSKQIVAALGRHLTAEFGGEGTGVRLHRRAGTAHRKHLR